MKTILLSSLALCSLTFSQEIQKDSYKIGDKEYTNVKLKKLNPVEVVITHSDGNRTININLLDPETKNELGYSKKEYDEYILKLKRQNEIMEEMSRIMKLNMIRVCVEYHNDDGILVNRLNRVIDNSMGIFNSSLSRVGGSNATFPSSFTWMESDVYFFIRHNNFTKTLSNGRKFYARFDKVGTYKIGDKLYDEYKIYTVKFE